MVFQRRTSSIIPSRYPEYVPTSVFNAPIVKTLVVILKEVTAPPSICVPFPCDAPSL